MYELILSGIMLSYNMSYKYIPCTLVCLHFEALIVIVGKLNYRN